MENTLYKSLYCGNFTWRFVPWILPTSLLLHRRKVYFLQHFQWTVQHFCGKPNIRLFCQIASKKEIFLNGYSIFFQARNVVATHWKRTIKFCWSRIISQESPGHTWHNKMKFQTLFIVLLKINFIRLPWISWRLTSLINSGAQSSLFPLLSYCCSQKIIRTFFVTFIAFLVYTLHNFWRQKNEFFKIHDPVCMILFTIIRASFPQERNMKWVWH